MPDDTPTASTNASTPPQAAHSVPQLLHLGDTLGPYTILSILGQGGFGVVYLAERREPHIQRVAIKVIKPGMDSSAVIARFEQERQALAVLDHPNVARVFDAGATPQGRPYFVMELVQGEPITTYADRARLTIKQRLELFLPICDAIQHAHHKGVIHRDIKPANVLVTLVNDKPIPKVIDFGVAKSVNPTLTAHTLFTEQGLLLGTPEYMSPEQADLGAIDVDARTDVYSLGVLLYELLTGALPFEPSTLRAAGFDEIRRIIREVDPPRPSVRLDKGSAIAIEAAHARRLTVAEHRRTLLRDLEWIPLKALCKDRACRYRTPSDLADDVSHYLAERPLAAGPASAQYRCRKYISRHKKTIAMSSMVAATLFIASTASIWQAATAYRARRLAQVRLDSVQSILGIFATEFESGQFSRLGVETDPNYDKEMLDTTIWSDTFISVASASFPEDDIRRNWIIVGAVAFHRLNYLLKEPWTESNDREWAEPLLRDVIDHLRSDDPSRLAAKIQACELLAEVLMAGNRIAEAQVWASRAADLKREFATRRR